MQEMLFQMEFQYEVLGNEEKLVKRKKLWKIEDLPDSNYYNHLTQFNIEKNEFLSLGAIPFDRRPESR